MATYDDIRKANESIQTTDIKGKNYAEVNQRIKAFRMVYPEGNIVTEMLSNENGVCIFRAIIGNGDITLGVGHAYEKEGSTFINKTSYIENCETSAVGRALGMAGFGIDTSVASAEEVQNAMIQQAADQKLSKTKVQALLAKCHSEGVSVDKLCNIYKVDSIASLNEQQHSNIITHWDKVLEVCKDGE